VVTRWTARAALGVIVSAILFALYLPYTNAIWPLEGRQHFLVAYAVLLAEIAGGGCLVIGLAVLIFWLWEKAR
jgi:hypothetical protein